MCTALHFLQQNLMPQRAQLYTDLNPHTEQNFRGADVVLGPAAAVAYVGISGGTRSSMASSNSAANERGPRFCCFAPRVVRVPPLPFLRFKTLPTPGGGMEGCVKGGEVSCVYAVDSYNGHG